MKQKCKMNLVVEINKSINSERFPCYTPLMQLIHKEKTKNTKMMSDS